jgi:tyrosyl-tRNA synthetase
MIVPMNELFERGVEDIIIRAELEKELKTGRKLRLKLGVDPTSPDIHLGHAVVLRILRKFQDQGHTVIFLIGDATTRIGDPSGRSATRPVLTDAEIEANAKTYLEQVGKILDIDKCEIRRNSEWFDKLDFAEILKLAGKFTVAQLIEREDFKKRLEAGHELGLHELLYPVMQAYDSVVLEADVEFGGTDQLFNLLAGRDLQKKMGQRPQQVFLSKLLVGTDGTHKMSKSLGNYIAVADEPVDMYGKVMSIPDKLIAEYYELCTDIEMSVIHELVKTLAAGVNPRDAKASLAREIVRIYHGETAALKAEDGWNQTFRDKEGPTEDQITYVGPHKASLVDFLLAQKIFTTRSEVRRLVDQHGIRINNELAATIESDVNPNDMVQVGKKRFYKLADK